MFNDDDYIAAVMLNRRWGHEQSGGAAIIPFEYEPIGVVPPSGFDPEAHYLNVSRALREIPPHTLRLVYDPYTKVENAPPWKGLHVYNVFEGMLRLEASCMRKLGCNMPDCRACMPGVDWPDGEPCAPQDAWYGRGIVAFIKAHHKARLGTSPARINKQLNVDRHERNDALQRRNDAELREVATHWWKEAATMASRYGTRPGPNGSRLPGRVAGRQSHLRRLPENAPKSEPRILVANG